MCSEAEVQVFMAQHFNDLCGTDEEDLHQYMHSFNSRRIPVLSIYRCKIGAIAAVVSAIFPH